ncbi:protocatechuate 3,4-dioxygenase subunit alpha [Corynebacterium ammoniagenes]|uniref:protocatechuate 3,4-dioxygenase subunit alpha n=1 Tax=Corynebacterium ammoniagenes TaxID=1697 RepID=UPI001459515E|nr:protocatechuate 3,4-dioxygenase subunit alpha [Corynebacterium ammoniagenes]NMF31777.1 protocatechuate 3,4-dioxygenase subunit alpha [Corynebacterium ammoniagenes]
MRIDKSPNGEFRYGEPVVGDQDETEFGIMPSQTVGPYVHIGLVREGAEIIADGEDAVEITVTTIDGDGNPISDSMVEFWQPDKQGVFNSEYDPRQDNVTADGFRGLGRAFADETGTSTLKTIIPGQIDAIDGFSPAQQVEAPHIKVGVFARGMLERLYTRLYFPEFAEANDKDPVLQLVDEKRRDLLIAQKTDKGYHFDIYVQHVDPEKETPFFDIVADN